jgi:catechol 2,3-dioxygenase-like lactoylglutathione lyase family enzyme
MATSIQVVFDCADPDRMAHFWATALGYKLQDPPGGFATWDEFLDSIGWPKEDRNSASAIVDPDGVGSRIYFQRVPEAKVVKNRVHLDLNVGGGREAPMEDKKRAIYAEVERLQQAGATKQREQEENGEFHIVMQDVEGNEFCLQ